MIFSRWWGKAGWRGAGMVLLMISGLWAQEEQGPFPRILFQRPAGIGGGAIQHFFSRFDLVVHGGAGPSAYALNESIHALNPRTLILGTSRQGVWPGSFPPECFIYRPHVAELTQTAKPGDTEIFVTSTAGFPPASEKYRYAMIGGDEWFNYTDLTPTSFTGVSTSGDFFLQRIHPVGDSIKTPIRFVGFGMLQNITPFAPLVEGKPVWQHFIDKRFDPAKQDFSYFDGIFYDAYRTFFYPDDIIGGIDLDYNRIDDFEEHGLKWVNAQWADGVKKMLTYEKQKLLELNPGQYPLIALNTGSALEDYSLEICDGMMWEGFMRFAESWEEMVRVNRVWETSHDPVYTMIEDYDPEKRRAYAKNKFAYMRYGLTTALMAGAYYGRTFGDYYYISLYYDEFDSDLGLPTSPPQKLSSGAWARFFEKGVAISNPTGASINVTDAELRAASGYAGPYYRFLGGQDPVTNNGERFQFAQLEGTLESPPKYIKGDGILLFTEPDTIVSDIMVGNCFNNDTSPASEKLLLEGAWTEVKDPSTQVFDENRNPCYSQWSDETEDGIGYAAANYPDRAATALFTPTIGVAGFYEISEWHGWAGNVGNSGREASNAEVAVEVNGVAKFRGRINQREKAGRWNRIAVVYLPAGTKGSVRLTNAGADGVVLADAMRFRFLGQSSDVDSEPPAAPRNVRVIKP